MFPDGRENEEGCKDVKKREKKKNKVCRTEIKRLKGLTILSDADLNTIKQ